MRPVVFVVVATCLQSVLIAQNTTPELKLDTGKEIYEAACIGCHGPGGKGQPESTLGFEKPPQFPDFSDCNGSAREDTFDWKATIHQGGPARGWSEIMPSFADALTLDQVEKVMQYLRSLCSESAWPLGELNLPRAFATEKAFPEDEWVLTTAVNAKGAGGIDGELVYERRFGVRNQLEFAAPYGFLQRDNNSWVGGIGDLVFGYKRVLFQSMRSGSIFSLQGEVALPTGNRLRDLGSGVTTFGPFAAFGQRLPGLSFFQIQTGAELPVNTKKAPQAAYFHTAVGKTFAQDHGFGRIWTPMIEFLAERDLVSGARTNWDLLPEMQVSLNKRHHVRASFGVRTPANNTAGRATQLMFYVLWDWFDGGLREGW
ncbi:MAG: cytochrome c, class I [Acidobacteria bacterium]|nr:MAG: cytochrome c, class I [Acidobacteriota bacterium]